MAGKSTEALNVLDAYLASHPSDSERFFIALRVIYEAYAAGRTIGTPEEDRERFQRYSEAYAAAGGQQGGLVEQWKKFIEQREV
jgi:hypothetical protein